MPQVPNSPPSPSPATSSPGTEAAPSGDGREQRILAIVAGTLAIVALGGGIVASRFLHRGNAAALGRALDAAGQDATLALPRPLPDFTLVDTASRTVSRTDFAGHYLVVSFVFTSCSTSCRAVNDRMAEIQQRVAPWPDVRLVSFTVDPRTDTPEVLGAFARRYGADPERWRFLTGNKSDMYELLETGFLTSSPALADLFPGGFIGTDRIMLVNRQGTVCASFDGLRRDVATTVTERIRELRSQSSPP